MKIYQIHRKGSKWGNYQDEIVYTCLTKPKAQTVLTIFEDSESLARRCDDCPLDYCPPDCHSDCEVCTIIKEKIKKAHEYCNICDTEKDDDRGIGKVRCKNHSCHYGDDFYFNIEEVDVVEE